MHMLNPYCGVDRDPRGVVRLTISNAGPLNILGFAAINGLRDGLELLATDRQICALVIAGQGEKSMIGGADIKEMATLDQASAEKFIAGLRDLCEAVRGFPAPVIARLPGWCLGGGLEFAAACDFRIAAHDAKFAHARGQGRNPQGHSRRLAAAADRLGPRPLAGHDRERLMRRPRWLKPARSAHRYSPLS